MRDTNACSCERAPPIRVEALAVAARMGARPRTAVGGAVLVVLVLARAAQVGRPSAGHVGEAQAAAAVDAAPDALRRGLVPRVRRIAVRTEAPRRGANSLTLDRRVRRGPVNIEPGILLFNPERTLRQLLERRLSRLAHE